MATQHAKIAFIVGLRKKGKSPFGDGGGRMGGPGSGSGGVASTELFGQSDAVVKVSLLQDSDHIDILIPWGGAIADQRRRKIS